ncbi:late blight resistance protein R1-A-like [Andrographis paniculata]|uniref:late blight resistance protein R1-A-like n=1 Tax=Andrographis paniculata TaxID=175694 RepID=UPI0021E92BAF|nr:late blight resistance protein R1-A-like [Andrographis paniculata]
MAYYAALVSLVHLLDDIILRDRYPNFYLCKQPIVKTLHEKFSFLEALLQDYSSNGDEANVNVEARIRDVAYRAQDVIETGISNQVDANGRDLKFSTSQRLAMDDLLKVYEDVDSIVKDVITMKESPGNEDLQGKNYSAPTGTLKSTSTGVNTMVGFDEDLLKIKDQLCGHSSELQVIPIVGMGGMGKTTLARAAFNDRLILEYFDRLVWIVVSQDYRVNEVLLNVLKCMDVEIDGLNGKEVRFLKEHIYKGLIGRRYLIVIDDVWSAKVWDDIKHAFPNSFDGSRILLTTRLVDVANYVRSSEFLHEMQFLDEDASWNLLREKVFAQEHCPQDLEDIGKLIASECKGLPLAIVVIAGILSDILTTQHWEKVSGNVCSFLSKSGDEHLSNILSLSYNHLPHLLKACFLYIGSFPEDSEINVRRLTRLWVAEGFLKLVERFETAEQMAEECLEDLVKRNLVLIVKKRANGRFKNCMMHDVLRDFCRQRAVNEGFFHGIDWERCFRLRNTNSDAYSEPWAAQGARKQVQTILWFNRLNFENVSVLECPSFRLLKILDASDAERCSAPRAFSRMCHLKYVALKLGGNEKLQFLPHIFKLRSLQTLMIYSPYIPRLWFNLPPAFWQMARLRHLIISPSMTLPPLSPDGNAPLPVRRLEDLQTLETVENFVFTKKAVEMLPNLTKLNISITEGTSRIWEMYGLGNLVHLRRLEELRISFNINMQSGNSLGSSFAFPENLKKLSLFRCKLHWNEMTAVGSLPSLRVLMLKDYSFSGEEWKPVKGEFQQLKFLLMEGLNLKHWRADNTHFPRLQHLKIYECYRLEKIPDKIGEIGTLESITVYDSSMGARNSAKDILEEQRSEGNDDLRVFVH